MGRARRAGLEVRLAAAAPARPGRLRRRLAARRSAPSLLPETLARTGPVLEPFLWLVGGFLVFFLLEQFLHWRHDHGMGGFRYEPVTYLILVADGLHNFLGGLAIRRVVPDRPAGRACDVAGRGGPRASAGAGGLRDPRARRLGRAPPSGLQFATALAIVPGGILAYAAGRWLDTTFLLPLAAGNFLYIAASDLIPEIKHPDGLGRRMLHLAAFVAGILGILAARLVSA